MLDRLLAPRAERALNRWAVLVLQSGMTPNRLTIVGLAFSLGAAFAAGMQAYAFSVLLFLLGRLFDGLAGMMARLSRITALGSYFDIVCDIAALAAFIFFFSLGLNGTAMAAAFFLFAYLLSTVAWLAATTFGNHPDRLEIPRSLLFGNSEAIILAVACCIVPLYFPALIAIAGLLCLADAVLRVWRSARALKKDETGV